MERKIYDICIIGGGAAGLACAAEAAKLVPGISIFIVEKNDVLGRKILSTGNGRCNLSNVACPGHEKVLRFFDSIGVITRTDGEGRIYPYSEDAKDVADALTDAVIRRRQGCGGCADRRCDKVRSRCHDRRRMHFVLI